MGSAACRAIVTLAVIAMVAACGPSQPTPSPSPPSVRLPSATVPRPTPTRAPLAVDHEGPLASSGSIVVVAYDGSLWLVSADGAPALLATADEAAFFMPAWSPDATRVAALRFAQTERSILVYDAGAPATEPVEIFRSAEIAPFYLSWTPDGARVAFLADEAGTLSLRIAPANGRAPVDGSGPGATVRIGNPFYFDWVQPDRILAHVGAGPESLLGEIGMDGEPVAPGLGSAGDFRSPVVSPDRSSVGFVRAIDGDATEVVVAARDGSSSWAMPVVGTAAVAFDPTGTALASVGAIDPADVFATVPQGPLRLIDRESGEVRTILDGAVLGFWWSPDGRTIAALRLQPKQTPADSSGALPSPTGPTQELRLLMVDVATGEIGAQHLVLPGQLFIDQVLSYFDQYALSHHLWAPDSSSFLMPVRTAAGRTEIGVYYRNGDPPATIRGVIAFWSPATPG
jgi:hypothetical protein